MRSVLLAALLLAAVPATAQKATMTDQLPPPPRAEQRPTSFERHGVTLVLATEDGTRGVHGRVTLPLAQRTSPLHG